VNLTDAVQCSDLRPGSLSVLGTGPRLLKATQCLGHVTPELPNLSDVNQAVRQPAPVAAAHRKGMRPLIVGQRLLEIALSLARLTALDELAVWSDTW
jgi:hypothetical protein